MSSVSDEAQQRFQTPSELKRALHSSGTENNLINENSLPYPELLDPDFHLQPSLVSWNLCHMNPQAFLGPYERQIKATFLSLSFFSDLSDFQGLKLEITMYHSGSQKQPGAFLGTGNEEARLSSAFYPLPP